MAGVWVLFERLCDPTLELGVEEGELKCDGWEDEEWVSPIDFVS